jgi:neutral ceramidase
VDLADVSVRPPFTGDGKVHRTSGPAGGAASFAGAGVDGPAFHGFREGANPWWDWPAQLAYRWSPATRDAQAPKGIVLPGGLLNRVVPVVAQRVPVQLLRIGPLYLIGIPGEVTITAGLRLRRTVAAIVGAELRYVLVAGYANGYIHYVTTPEEYDAQRYEGASTLFGRWELPALVQTVAELATAMHAGAMVDPGPTTTDLSARARPHRDRTSDTAPAGSSFGDVLVEPRPTYAAGQRATVVFVAAHPNNGLRRGGTYLEVQRAVAGADGADGAVDWRTVFDDGDWSTRFVWKRSGRHTSEVTVTWDIPEDVAAGRYRIRYLGDAKDEAGVLHPFHGVSPEFGVTSP